MHREGYIMQEITTYGNMSEAFDRVLRGKKRKRCRQGRYLLAHREEVIAELTAKLADGSFRLGGYHERTICEYGKVRHLQILSIYDRIAVYAVMNVVDAHLHKRFIRTTGASIKKRGTHDLRKCMQRDMERDPDGTRYCYKFDVEHFYDNTKPEFVMWCFHRVFKDNTLLSLLDHFLHLLPDGISFGLRSSQSSGNLLLSVFLDHYLKDRYGIRYFYRYCDDGVVLCSTKAECWKVHDIVHEQTRKIDLKIKPNERLVLSPADLLDIFEGHGIARKKLKSELQLFMQGERNVEKYREAGINWWDYCGAILVNSYPTYFEKLPPLIAKINREKRNSKNYVLFLGSTDAETNQAPCLSLVQFQIEDGALVLSAYQRSSDANLGLPADIYHLYLMARQIDLPLKSITLNIANVHIYENNIANTRLLLEGNENVKFELNV